MLASKKTRLAASCVFHLHISDLRILHLRICITPAHLHISDPHISDFHILHLHIRRSSHLRSSYLLSSHLCHICASSYLGSSYLISSNLHVLKPHHLVFTSSDVHHGITLSYLIIFKISLCYICSLIYLRLQNFVSPCLAAALDSFTFVWGQRWHVSWRNNLVGILPLQVKTPRPWLEWPSKSFTQNRKIWFPLLDKYIMFEQWVQISNPVQLGMYQRCFLL